MEEIRAKLNALGKKTEYKQDYAPEVLEAFDNKHQENDYWVRFNCPEFTSLCPITGQPDFAEIRIGYIPDVNTQYSLLKLSSSLFPLIITDVGLPSILLASSKSDSMGFTLVHPSDAFI